MSTENSKKEFNIFEFLNVQVQPILRRLKKIWIVIPIVSILGFIIGFYIERQKTPVFSAKITYMLEDEIMAEASKGSNSQIMAMLSGQGGQSNKGIMVDLSLSNKLVEETLLRTEDIDGKKQVLANHIHSIVYQYKQGGYRNPHS